jgi:sortase B
MKKEKNSPNKAKKIIFWVSFAIFLLGLIFILFLLINAYFFPETHKPISAPSGNSADQIELPDNPIDFEAEKLKYPDIYAWINIPNTKVNYPVVQSPTDDSFYLDHNAEKKYTKAGAIYSEIKNNKDFSDPNTVLYGHNMLNGSMFRDLHNFRKDENFWNENKYIYIYTPGHILTYEICAAYRYDNRHILNSFNFSDSTIFEEYLETVKNPKSLIMRTREVELNKDSKILTLSTCISNPAYRYLVQGVLIKDEPTK